MKDMLFNTQEFDDCKISFRSVVTDKLADSIGDYVREVITTLTNYPVDLNEPGHRNWVTDCIEQHLSEYGTDIEQVDVIFDTRNNTVDNLATKTITLEVKYKQRDCQAFTSVILQTRI